MTKWYVIQRMHDHKYFAWYKQKPIWVDNIDGAVRYMDETLPKLNHNEEAVEVPAPQ
jgi:hypothetical protein